MSTTAPVTHDPFADYALAEAYDELFDAKAQPRRAYKRLYKELMNLTPEELGRSKQKADLSFFNQGITFTVYGRKEGTERIFPHDLLPRIISGSRLGRHRARTDAADHRAEPVSQGHLSRAPRSFAIASSPREAIYTCRITSAAR